MPDGTGVYPAFKGTVDTTDTANIKEGDQWALLALRVDSAGNIVPEPDPIVSGGGDDGNDEGQ